MAHFYSAVLANDMVTLLLQFSLQKWVHQIPDMYYGFQTHAYEGETSAVVHAGIARVLVTAPVGFHFAYCNDSWNSARRVVGI